MKRYVILCLMLLSLTCLAQEKLVQIEQVGEGHWVEQVQEGSHFASVAQSFLRNTAAQHQYGYQNEARVIQLGMAYQNRAFQNQNQAGNRALIDQSGGSENRAVQSQNGTGNAGGSAVLFDPVTGHVHNQEPYGAVIIQQGLQCEAVQRQEGSGNYNYIFQGGVGQKAEVNQNGVGLSHVLIQYASYVGPQYTITQSSGLSSVPRPTVIVHQY